MSQEDNDISIELRQWEAINKPSNKPVKFLPHENGYGPEECVRCDSPMPEARRAYGFQLCVACKTADERRSRPY